MRFALAAVLPLIAVAAGCGGADPAGAPAPTERPPATASAFGPGTPAPAPPSSNPPPIGGSGSNRFEVGAGQGLYLVDPAAGEPSVQGFVVVTLGPIGTGAFIPPADTVVTLNGVPLLRDPNLNGAYWRLDPAGPQPVIGSGGRMVIVATGTVAGQLVSRTLVLPCPADVAVTPDPADGATLTAGGALHLTSTADLTVNVGVPLMASIFPQATLFGYDAATRALAPSGSPHNIGPGPLDVTLPVTSTAAPGYLLDLRWPGQFVLDGETGGFCGLAKRFTYAR